MVVFEGGLPRPGHYRKFAVRTAGPDDFAMIAEVVTRRFSREIAGEAVSERKESLPPEGTDESFSSRPDLIIVDGGAGQVSAAVAALQSLGLADLPVVGIAKKREEVYINGTSRPLVLPLDSPALGLLMQARDEAHRFAVAFHRQRRSRELSSSILDELPGIGPARKRAILEHFGSPAKFMAASRDELEAVPGLPAKVAREVYALVHKLG
jgi:excinuclease ABC subunit C